MAGALCKKILWIYRLIIKLTKINQLQKCLITYSILYKLHVYILHVLLRIIIRLTTYTCILNHKIWQVRTKGL